MAVFPYTILLYNRQTKLCYIGFSQGTAQAFAAFSSNADLLDKICLFVALSPAARANHLSPSLLLSLVQANLRCEAFMVCVCLARIGSWLALLIRVVGF